ncbi:4-hydroxybenzoyl-CoA reductase subunit beta [Dethiosulfatibacter aminovorans DSM 17477]|uniref:4-hydroxybenzoyl-CoA reductase subunit beta n=1 Tax=Dethiosulfatibacter aminovorans DSM 17477 TaxID=1121476 RepID=A0A1M6AB05_9FIRM|nr:FAD binding domain-containing protein [Dethiosulfatibacter aminovorans]SHI33651.1 4-hydroxybenzoyl-CoA reductase subunit beta [Dethiosulfatibacter aminovorans DSM 17477]
MILDSKLKYHAPKTMNELVSLWKNTENSKILGGGTDLIPLMKYGVKDPDCLLSISKLEEAKGIAEDDDHLSIGAHVTLEEISKNRSILKHFPSLAYSARCVASPQIRNTATIGGNIMQDRRCIYYNQTDSWRSSIAPCFKTGGNVCHQAPNSPVCKALYYSDVAPVLMALEAEAIVVEKGSEKAMAVSELVASHVSLNGTTEETDILVLRFILKKDASSTNSFYKYSIRQSIDFPVLNIAVNYRKPAKDGQKNVLNIIAGAAGPGPIKLEETEKNVLEHIISGNMSLEELCDNAIEEITKKSNLVRETGLSIQAKRKYLKNIVHAVKDLIDTVDRT